jgi:hypothetical protein
MYRFSNTGDNPNVSKKGRILTNEEYLTPLDILKNNPYFDEFRVNNNNNKKVIKKNELINIDKFLNGNNNTLSMHPKIRTTEMKRYKSKSKSKSKKSKRSKSKKKSRTKSKSKKEKKEKNKKSKKSKSKKKFNINDLIEM